MRTPLATVGQEVGALPTAGGAPSSGAGRQRRRLVNGMRWWVPWMFLAPTLIFVAALLVVPLLGGLLIAFTDWNVVSGLDGIEWIGLQNFTDLLTDGEFWAATARTVLFTASVPLTMIVGLCLATALNKAVAGRAALRVIFFVPTLVNAVAVGTIWLILLNPESGLINNTLRSLGIADPPAWLISQTWALPALILLSVWGGAGFTCVIYLAALQDLPHELYEAATLDGAGRARQFTTITWPGLFPTTVFLAITSMIGKAQGFGLIAYMTAGGPGRATTVLSYYMYESGFLYYRFGYAAAIGVLMLIGVLIMTLLLWRYQKGRGLYA